MHLAVEKKLKTKIRIEVYVIFASIALLIALMYSMQIFLPSKYMPEANIAELEIINETEIKLPEPRLQGEMSLEETLLKRKSVREYLNADIKLEQLSQLLWAAQGITREWGGRTAPSAGGTYPLELYIQVRRVERLQSGIYNYDPREHTLKLIKLGNFSDSLMQASLDQSWVGSASLNIVMTADFSRTTSRYGERGVQYVYMEAGHAAQNIYLQVAALKLGCVTIGAFDDAAVQEVLSAPENHKPIYVIPVGVPSSQI